MPARNPVLGPLLLLMGAGLLSGAGCGGRGQVADEQGPAGENALLYWQIPGDDSIPPHDLAESVRAATPHLAVLDVSHSPTGILHALRRDAPEFVHLEPLSSEDGALILLSTQPLLATQSESNITYRMAGEAHYLRCGILDATVQRPSGFPLRIIAVSIKDKTFHPAGQSEMRRNELRLVSQHIQRLIRASPQTPVVLVGALNDRPDAAGLRGLTGGSSPPLMDLRPVDPAGDAWTSHDRGTDQYLRNHYVMTRGDPVTSARILNDPSFRRLSRHRPLWMELRTTP